MILSFLVLLFLNSTESSLLILKIQPISDVSALADLKTLSPVERQRGTVLSGFLGSLNTSSFSGAFWKDFYGTGYFSFLSFSYKIDQESGANFAYYSYNSGDEDIYHLDGSVERVAFERDYILSASYGFRVNDNLSFGIKGKYISSTLIEKYSASTYAFDADVILAFKKYMLMAGFENLGGKIRYLSIRESLPFFIDLEFSRDLEFKNILLSAGVGLKASKEYSSTSVGLHLSGKSFPLRLFSGYKKAKNSSHYFIGSGLMVENLYLSFSLGFPKIINSNEFKLSLTYFFDSIDSFPNFTSSKESNLPKTPSDSKLSKQKKKAKPKRKK